MMVCTLFLTFSFGSSDKLAGAYGTAVSTTMLLTTALLFNAMRDIWRWPTVVALLVSGVFLLIDLAFFGANLLKIREGGWIPLLLGALIFLVMTTWRRGIDAIRRIQSQKPEAIGEFLAQLKNGTIARVPGTAVFFSRFETAIPPVMIRHVAQMKALQETVISLTVQFEDTPGSVGQTRRGGKGRRGIVARHHPVWLCRASQRDSRTRLCRGKRLPLDLDDAVYFASHDDVVRRANPPRLPAWRRMLFAVMYRNAVRTPTGSICRQTHSWR